MPAEERPEILYDVKDASWRPNTKALTSIVLSNNHIVKTIFDPLKQRFVSLQADYFKQGIMQNLPGIIDEIYTTDSMHETNWFFSFPKTMIVPEALYEEPMERDLFKNHHIIGDSETVESYPLRRMEARLIYARPAATDFPKIKRLIPVDAAWLESLYLQQKSTTETVVHLNINDDFISVAVFKDSALQLYNTYNAATPEERLYYIMFVSEQLGINPQKDRYSYSGFIKKGDSTTALFEKYIKHVLPGERPSRYSYSMPLLEVPGHLFFNAYCTPVCES